MNIFTSLEKSLEGLIESTLLNKFGGKVQPIEIARGIWAEITAGKRISVNGTYVPNYFLVTLSGEDYGFLETVRDTVDGEIIQYLKKECRERDFCTLGPFAIHWARDEEARKGKLSISSDFLRREEIPHGLLKDPAHSTTTGTDTLSKKPSAAKPPPPAFAPFLEVVEGFDRGRRFLLQGRETVIGRGEDCQAVIGDPQVSRRHARIVDEGGQACLEDLKSRGGVMVNGRSVEKARLKDGDLISLGLTTLCFRDGGAA
jgi:hypothetical protein